MRVDAGRAASSGSYGCRVQILALALLRFGQHGPERSSARETQAGRQVWFPAIRHSPSQIRKCPPTGGTPNLAQWPKKRHLNQRAGKPHQKTTLQNYYMIVDMQG